MKTKIFALFAAMMLLMGTTVMAQSDKTESATEIKGDVNSDGIVDVADIAAVIAVINEQGTVAPQYYWYVGQENPADLPEDFDPEDVKVTDNSSPGWRLIGTTKPTSSTFTSNNMLWDGDTHNISFGARIISYIAIPYKPLQMWDITGGDGLFYSIQNNGNPVNINGVDYYVYMSDYKTAAFTMNIYNK